MIHDKPNQDMPRRTRGQKMVCGLPFHVLPHQEVLEEMEANIRGPRRPQFISITNSEVMYYSRRMSFLVDHIRSATFSLCDSISIVFAGALQGVKLKRFTGPDLMEKSCRYGTRQEWRHFFCGGAQGVAELLSANLTAKCPRLITAGTYCPPFRPLTSSEENEMIQAINAAKPDILWIGLGAVRQELWIARFFGRLDIPWIVGVGGAFDYHAQTVPRAPKWLRALGMEWLYRLCREPWRFKRILSSYVNLLEVALETVRGRPVVLGNSTVNEAPAWRGKPKL